MTDDRYRSPLGTRYASPAMQTLWGEPPPRSGSGAGSGWRWPKRSGSSASPFPTRRSPEMRAHLDDADLDAAAEYERRFRHDVMAHVHAFGDQAPGRAPVHPPGRHQRLRHRQRRPDRDARRPPPRCSAGSSRCSARSTRFADALRAPCPAWPTPTSSRPSSPRSASARRSGCRTSRSTSRRLCHRLETLRFRGCKGTTARRRPSSSCSTATTQGARARPPRRREAWASPRPFAVTGQTYPRKLDSAGARRR